MLTRIGGKVMTPEKMLKHYELDLPREMLKNNQFLQIVHQVFTSTASTYG